MRPSLIGQIQFSISDDILIAYKKALVNKLKEMDVVETTSGGSSTMMIIIIIFVVFFLLLLILVFVFFFRRNDNVTTNNRRNCNCPAGPIGPMGPAGPPGSSSGSGGTFTRQFPIQIPSGTGQVPILLGLGLPNSFNYSYVATINVQNGTGRIAIPANSPNSNSPVKFDTYEQLGTLYVNFYGSTVFSGGANAILSVTAFPSETIINNGSTLNTFSTLGQQNIFSNYRPY